MQEQRQFVTLGLRILKRTKVWLDLFISLYVDLRKLFNAKAILLEEQ